MKKTFTFKQIFSAMLLLAAMAIGNSALAQTFDIEATYNSNTHKTLFTITRSGSSLPQQTIKYRTVNLSAYAGIHYTAVSDTYTFPENITTFQVEVSESAQYTTAYAYHYQTGTTRSYRFEVLDVNGFELAHNDRSMTTGAQFSNTYLNNSVTDLVYFTDGGSIMSGSGNKYLDVSYSSSNWTQVTDAGYSQGVHTVSTNSLYNSNSNLRTILTGLSYKMYATVYFTQKEEHDGYQYIQIYTGNAGTYDNVDDPNGDIGTLTNSLYRACFILSKSASVMTSEHHQFFPHRYDYVNKAAETTAGITHYEFDYDDSYLYKQKYLSSSYKSSTSGSLVLLPTAENINIRFDAGGGGLHDNDEWDFKNLKVRLALVDETYPTPINIAGITVSAGPYVKGNTFYISVPFSEIVNTAYCSGYKKLVTSWGDATYDSGDGTNVITFKGTINANAGTTLAITSLQCNFKDLTGTLFQGLGNSGYTDSFDKTFNGVTCTESYTLAATNTEFAGLQSEYVVSNNAIHPRPMVYFYKGIKNNTNQVRLYETIGYTLSWTNAYSAGTGSVTATGTGNYNGSISATYPIRWSTYTVSFHDNGSVGIPATGEMSDQSFEYGVAQNLTANAFSREGFTFAGWNTQPDGSGASYSDGEAVTGLTSEDGGTVDLYAQWTAIPWTGSGTSEDDPYMILYASQLDLLATNVNGGNNYSGKFFKLDADITYVHNTAWNDATSTENNYTAIGGSYGDSYRNFKGVFDGDGHTISGIRIYKGGSSNDDSFQGLFGRTYDGSVLNVTLTDARITGYISVGGIMGERHYGHVVNCHVTSTVAIHAVANNSTLHGGIVGYNLTALSSEKILNCTSAATISIADGLTGCNKYGGIVGKNQAGKIENCLVVGASVSGNSIVGAIIGEYYHDGTYTANYYRGCTVNGSANAINVGTGSGDIAGARSVHTLNLGDNITASGESVVIDNVTYYASNTTITLGYTGTINPGYKLGYTYNDGTAHAVVGNTFEMPASDVTVSSTFTDVWGIAGGTTGSETHPYIISDTTGLNVLAKCVNGTHGYTANSFYNKHFRLNNDITYTHTTDWNDANSTENNYTAIGKDSHLFRGTFDGNGHTISGIRIYNPTNDYQGLFGYVYSGSTVKNIALANSIIIGGDFVGSIAGKNEYGTITNCRIGNDVTIGVENDDKDYHGGIVGYQYNGTVSGSVIAASVNGLWYCGGIAGICVFTTLKDCLYTGTVANGSWKGAITGKNNNSTLTNNYYTSNNNGGVNGSDCDGARRARTITLGEHVGIAGDQTAYDVSGITAIGTSVLSYNNGTSTTIYSGATQTITLSNAAPQGCVVTSYILNGTPLVGNTFTMPDSNVTVNATIGVPYIDADGNEQICNDYTLIESSTGSAVILGAAVTETWYAVSGNVNITSSDEALILYGAAHLILMDDATLTVEGSQPISAYGSLSIYGQSLGTGSLVATGSDIAIYVDILPNAPVANDGSLTINGGIVTAASSSDGISATNDITINGGVISATGDISGKGINANGALTLGWRNATDRIYASSYNGDNGVVVKSGQYLSDGTAVYSGSLSDTQIDALAGQTLQPVFTLTLPKYVNATSGVLAQEGRIACALADANVTLAAEGCTLADVTVGGEAATDNGDGTWSFAMPATDATVSATVTAIDFTTGHAGTEADPYIIMYRSHLDLLATRVNGGESYNGKFIKLGADIAYDPNDLDDNGENYTAIGTKVNHRYFKGSFDGDGHIISGIRINKTGDTNADKKQGLFGYVNNAFIKNVVLSDASITGYTQVGGILGEFQSSTTIQNCFVLNSHIIANNNTTNRGVIAGYYYSGLTLIDNYYYNCTVNGASNNVGADGSDRDGARGVNKLTLCEHVIATPAAAVTYQGNSYYVAGTSVTLSVEEGYTLNGSYTVKDANNNDVALTGGDTFEMPASDVTVNADITVTIMAGSGTENDPWIIMYRTQMDQLAISEINNGQYYQLGRDLTYSYEGLGETESNYTPILVNEGGHFDGAGHTISGIRIYPYDDFYDVTKGLFSVNYGTVKNVTLTDAIITGDDYVGGIVGSNTKNGLIDSCHVTSTVIIKAYGYASDYHGGISGDNAGGVDKMPAIRNCTSAAILTNNGYENCDVYGGIVGENVGGIVSGCTAYGASVTAIGAAGGIVGYNYWCCDYEDPVVENCFAIDCTINSGSAGAIISNSGYATLNHNYYYNCTANDNTTDIGYKDGDITEDDGAVQVFSLTLGEHITATATAAYSYSGNNYYTEGTSVTLSPEEGYAISGSYTVKDADDNDVALTGGNTFEMPASDVTVSATTTELIAFKLYNEDYLVEGDYLIVYQNYAMNNEVSNDKFQFEEVDYITNDVIGTNDANIIWHIAHNDDFDYWTIYNAAAGEYAGAKDNGGGVCLYEDEDNGTWWSFADAPGDGVYYINNQYMYSWSNTSYLKFNTSLSCFSCYDINFGSTPSLYRKVETFTKDIKGYTDDESGWYLIASPLYNDVNVNNVKHMKDNTFDLYRFNQEAAAEWENWKAEGTNHYHFDLESGRGYLYANSKDVTLTFTGWPYSGNGIVELTKTEGVSFEGWNLVGNPWIVEATIEKDFYRMNDNGSEIIAATGNTVNPMEGIFVHTDSDYEEMTFTPNSNSTKGRSQSHEPERIVINLSTLNSKLSTSIIDRAIVRFDSERTMTKLQIFDGSTKLYIPQDGTDYAITFSNRQGEIPLNFKAKETGTYTISFEGIDLNNIELIDLLENLVIDLGENPSYAFIGSPADRQARFIIRFENSENSEIFAYQSGTDIIVTGDGELQIFDVMGRMVLTQRVNGVGTIAKPTQTGVYILKLNEKTQKIIMK